MTLWDAAASPGSQAFLLIGTLFILPIVFMYTGWSYYVFRGKVRANWAITDTARMRRAPAGALLVGTARPQLGPQSAGPAGSVSAGAGAGGALPASSSAAAFIDSRTRPLSSASITLTRTAWPSFT